MPVSHIHNTTNTQKVYVPGMRSKALVNLMRTAAPVMLEGRRRATQLPLSTYSRLLGFEGDEQAREFVMLHQVGGQ